MDETLILIYRGEELLAKFEKTFSPLGLHFYCIHNSLKLIDYYEMEAFVYAVVE